MQAEVTDLIEEGGRVVGRARHDAGGRLEIRADLVVGCDGRHSTVREQAGLEVDDFGAPMDVLWFRLSPRPATPRRPCGHFEAGRILVMLNRGDYWQCAYVIPKGGIEEVQARRASRRSARASPRSSPFAARPRRRDRELGRRQAADRRGRSAAALVPAGPALHRRRRARHVADRRRRHQPRGAGRGRRRQHPGRAAARRRRHARRSRRRAGAPRIPDAGHPARCR